ncbi:PLC-like phosphodiesterase [Xylariaceae sp. FL1019]|nr:PLC-like phosphodiesterase [Xylariaceae sp. FL1019]
MLAAQPRYNNTREKPGIMCITMPKKPTTSPPRRRLTFNVHGTETFSTLKRALNLALFIAPTPIYLHGEGDGNVGGKKEIYLSAAIKDPLSKLFHELCREGHTLSRKDFENFLEVEQGEPSNHIATRLTRDTYTFQQFLETWWLQFGFSIERPASIDDKDLTQPLCNYFINSSHNTYLTGHQWTGKATTETYRRVLLQGCRCIEIDVWNNDIAPSPRAGSTKGVPRSEHTRHISTSSLHTAAANLKGAIDDKIERGRQRLGVEKHHSRSPHCSQYDAGAVSPSREDRTTLNVPMAERSDGDGSSLRSVRSRPTIPRDEPIVMHGWTLNQPIGLRQVCKAVREAAFETSHLPVIISLEVHADQEQQESMVQIMKEEWAGLIVDTPLETCPGGQMPRLEDLKDRILIKVKKTALSTETTTTMASLAPGSPFLDDDAASESGDDRLAPVVAKPPKVPICENLSKLGVYTHSERFLTFDSPGAKIPSHIFSINEKRILELWEDQREELFAHNRNFLMRAYPKGSRINSTNPDPSQFWRKGVQMVAMNWQVWDEGMMLNKAMFSGEHGWVLKPPCYRSTDGDSIEQTADCLSYRNIDLMITVLAGQHIPLPEGMPHHGARKMRPFVKCELHVEKAEDRSAVEGSLRLALRTDIYKKQTGSGESNHPVFNPESRDVHFRDVHRVVEQLSFVRFRVEHRATTPLTSDLSSWACIRLDRLRTGYRFIPLMGPDGSETDGELLVKVFKSYRRP